MAGSLTNLLYHLVFSTKLRSPLIEDGWQDELYAYFGGIVRDKRGVLIASGGTVDHVHLLARLSPAISLSDVMRDVKANSSRWARDKRFAAGRFQWQTGYGAFSVSDSNLRKVQEYIRNQAQHHQKMSFQDEYVKLLRHHGIQYEERYLWD